MTGPQDPAAAGGDRLRAGHADREQVIEALKVAFVHGRLTKDELDTRAGQALSAQTRADLAALTADIPAVPSAPAAAGLVRPPTPPRRWPLARAAAKSGGCLVLAFALVLFAANVLDPHGLGNPYHPWSSLCAVVALGFVVTALGIFATGVATSVEQRRSRRQLPPRPGPGGQALEVEPRGGTGHGPVPPGPRTRRPDPRRPDPRRPADSRLMAASVALFRAGRPGTARYVAGTGRHITSHLRRLRAQYLVTRAHYQADSSIWYLRTSVLACQLPSRTGVRMRGRHARPSQAGKLTRQATRIAPAVAVAGALFGMPYHVKPPAASTTPVERVELTSSVKPASPARVYVVKAGDTLWSIAQQLYGNPLMWSRIYYANQSQIHDPNEIYPGQQFMIPQAGTSSATTSSATTSSVSTSSTSATPAPANAPSSPAPASSPSSVTGYIQQAAQGTGLPVSVIAAQVQVESSYNSGAISPAGAEGPYQFMPSTWATLGLPAGQEFDWGTSTHAYITFMRMLLAWSGGNVQQALAAYNAGQANWQVGLGYADQILSMAGQG